MQSIFSELLADCWSSVTFVRPILSRLKFSAMLLRHLVPWPSVDIHENFTVIVSGEPLHLGVERNSHSDMGPIGG